VHPDPDRSPGSPPGEPDPFPDPRPFRRIQAATALLIAVVAAVTLLSDERPAAVRWSAVAGMAVLILVVWWITRHRRAAGERDPAEKSENAGDM
jgi:hypothetical protein